MFILNDATTGAEGPTNTFRPASQSKIVSAIYRADIIYRKKSYKINYDFLQMPQHLWCCGAAVLRWDAMAYGVCHARLEGTETRVRAIARAGEERDSRLMRRGGERSGNSRIAVGDASRMMWLGSVHLKRREWTGYRPLLGVSGAAHKFCQTPSPLWRYEQREV